MAIYDNKRLVIKTCKLFYEQNMSQKDISLYLGISKPQVCRMLDYAKKQHIIEFHINNPFSQEFQLETLLSSKYNLKETYIFPISSASPEDARNQLGKYCAEQLDKYFTDNSTIGVMSGRTIAAVSDYAHKLPRKNLNFVPLVGNTGSDGHKYHANSIAENFARNTGGSYSLMNAPIVLQSEEVCSLVKKEPSIASTLAKGSSCNVALVGIGPVNQTSTSYLCGAYSSEDIEFLVGRNAVASVCTSFISKDSTLLHTELNSRSIGVSLSALSDTTVISIASGLEKAEAINAVLKSGYIDIFMTSLDMAQNLLS